MVLAEPGGLGPGLKPLVPSDRAPLVGKLSVVRVDSPLNQAPRGAPGSDRCTFTPSVEIERGPRRSCQSTARCVGGNWAGGVITKPYARHYARRVTDEPDIGSV